MGRRVGVLHAPDRAGRGVPRVRLGTYVLAVPYRNPAMLAKMAETLDEVSGGRVILGVGAGGTSPSSRVRVPLGAQSSTGSRRGCGSWSGCCARGGRRSTAARAGGVGAARAAGPRPTGCRCMVGAGGPRMLRLTAELADEWNAGMSTPARVHRRVCAADDADSGRWGGIRRRSADRSRRWCARAASRPADLDAAGSGDAPLTGSPEAIAAGLAATASSARTTSRSSSARTASKRSRRCDR